MIIIIWSVSPLTCNSLSFDIGRLGSLIFFFFFKQFDPNYKKGIIKEKIFGVEEETYQNWSSFFLFPLREVWFKKKVCVCIYIYISLVLEERMGNGHRSYETLRPKTWANRFSYGFSVLLLVVMCPSSNVPLPFQLVFYWNKKLLKSISDIKPLTIDTWIY